MQICLPTFYSLAMLESVQQWESLKVAAYELIASFRSRALPADEVGEAGKFGRDKARKQSQQRCFVSGLRTKTALLFVDGSCRNAPEYPGKQSLEWQLLGDLIWYGRKFVRLE